MCTQSQGGISITDTTEPVLQNILEGPVYNLVMLLAAVGAIAVGFIPVLRRRRQLTISSPSPVSVPGGTEVTSEGRALAAPYTAKISIQNTGRKQISCSWLEFDIKAVIAGVEANVEYRDRGSRLADHQVAGSTIRLKSFVLDRGDRIVVEMSTDGEPNLAGAANFSEDLQDTDITYRRVDTRVGQSTVSRRWLLALPFLVVGAALSAFALLRTGSDAPAISVSPSEGPPGMEVTVTGSNFGRLETLDIRLGDQLATRAQADEEGRFTVRFEVPPDARHGTNTIVASSGKPGGNTASSEFKVTPP